MKIFKNRLFYLVLLALILIPLAALTACSKTPTVTTTATPTTPAIIISSPTGGVVPQIGDVTVSVQVTNFTLVNKLGLANAAGQGHIHYFMDVDAPTTAGKPAVTAAGTYAATPDISYTWHNVGGGPHKFSVELVNNDHTPLNPPVVATVNVTVLPEIGPSSLVIVSPRNGATVTPGDVMITVQVSNFNVVDKQGQPSVSHEGHLHYFLDVQAPTTQGQPAIPTSGTWAHVSDTMYTFTVSIGTHTVYVELVNNDHTPLNPPVVAQVTFNVAGPAATTTTPPATTTKLPTTTTNPATTTPPSGQSVAITLTAKNMAFDKSTITVPAGAQVTMTFINQDSVPHNFALYTDSTASKSIFVGQIVSNTTVTYKFTAPTAPGTYFFRCDVHPSIMTGNFIVQ
jgi:plastocyanin